MHRRNFLQAAAGTAASAWFGANLSEILAAGRFAAEAPQEKPWEFLTAEQARLLDAVTAQIIPTDDTPGAREARVVRFIDHSLATFRKGQQQPMTNSLKELQTLVATQRPGGPPFVEMSSADQIAMLTEFEKSRRPLFNYLRNQTMVGMFAHPVHGGNYQKIGWKLIGFEDRYSWAPPFGYYDRA